MADSRVTGGGGGAAPPPLHIVSGVFFPCFLSFFYSFFLRRDLSIWSIIGTFVTLGLQDFAHWRPCHIVPLPPPRFCSRSVPAYLRNEISPFFKLLTISKFDVLHCLKKKDLYCLNIVLLLLAYLLHAGLPLSNLKIRGQV